MLMKCNLALCQRETIDGAFILMRSLLEEYHAKGKKLHKCFGDPETDFDRVPRKVDKKEAGFLEQGLAS